VFGPTTQQKTIETSLNILLHHGDQTKERKIFGVGDSPETQTFQRRLVGRVRN
jgi:hypothetical protein